ncbi:MAG: mechanosensitive ion channel [Paracoccaceae bacterium]|nr:mechanosensitive ion channel [Paracoccaceae bacterium]
MRIDELIDKFRDQTLNILNDVWQVDSYVQFGVILVIYTFAYWVALRVRKASSLVTIAPTPDSHPLRKAMYQIDRILFPLIAILLLKFGNEASRILLDQNWILTAALTIAVLTFFNSLIGKFVGNKILIIIFKYIGLPILFFHLIGWLDDIGSVLRSISVSVGNISISAYGLARVGFFGAILLWLGGSVMKIGEHIIRKQESLDVPTREVFAKLFQVGLFCIIFILLLNMMGINLTALAVFSGALGVGLGFGLQSIASNFISGIIILLDHSITVDDYIELEDGRTGFVREFKMRFITLETYDGKDIMVPNEIFISSTFINWSHKDPKQRYRVDFLVAYSTDIRSMVEIVKEVVASHPQVISGEDIPIEIRPDCEIDSFGDSGVNMFVEFWMEGIDDGKNRVGGDLLLAIFEVLREHGIQIPLPQREVRVLNEVPEK